MLYQILYTVFTTSETIRELYGQELSVYGYKAMLVTDIIKMIFVYAVLYVFRSAALYRMAKNRGLNCAYLAFIPFACFILMGKLQPDGKYTLKSKKLYIFALVSAGLYFAINLSIDIIYAFKPLSVLLSGVKPTSSDFASDKFLYNTLGTISFIVGVCYIVFSLFMYSNVYKAYVPQKVARYTLLTIFIYVFTNNLLLAGIFLFINRNADVIDYDAYINGIKRQFYYNSGYDMHKNNYNRNRNTTVEDPFSEFASKKDDDPFAEFNDDNNSTDNKQHFDMPKNNDDSDDLF